MSVLRAFGNSIYNLRMNRKFAFRFLKPEEALIKLLTHSYRNIPYYYELFKETGLVEKGGINLAYFNRLPLVTKEVLRENIDKLISKDINNRKWHYNYSGGSTGIPTKFIQDITYDLYKEKSSLVYFNEILGMDYLRARKLFIWGSERDILKQRENKRKRLVGWLENSIYLNCFNISDKELKQYVSTINSFKPEIIRGYVSALYELSKYIIKNNIKIYKPKIIVLQAENVTEEMKISVQQAFNTKAYNFYGSREVSCIAGECHKGSMHIFSFWNYVEVVDNRNILVKEGKEGRVLVTNLYNYAMPLIRYEIGDNAILGANSCLCGSVLPVLNKISGRTTENFINKDGTVVPAEFFIHFIGVVCNDGSIDKFQVIQEEFDKIRVLYTGKNDISSKQRITIDENVKKVMGKECLIVWEKVNDIAKTPEGKYLYVKSLVNKQRSPLSRG